MTQVFFLSVSSVSPADLLAPSLADLRAVLRFATFALAPVFVTALRVLRTAPRPEHAC